MNKEFKLALLYTAWTGDDMEMLKASIRQHKPHVDMVYVCFQFISNKGEHFSMSLNDMDGFPTNTQIFSYTPDLSKNTKENERIKHDFMIQSAKKQGFTHFIMGACDHFYDPNQIEWAKEYHKTHDIDLSITAMRTYYKRPNWYLDPAEDYFMPFIHKMKPETAISRTATYPVRVDPSVKVNTAQSIVVFNEDQVLLHHHSMIRKDIPKKLRNAAASVNWSQGDVQRFISEYENAKPGDSISYFQGRKIVELE